MPAVGGFLAVASNPNMRDTVGVMIDFFGSGTSDHVEQFSYTPEAHAECVAAVMDHLRCGPCPVVGHSMGGTVAIALGLQRPDLVSQLVIAEGNITPGGGFLTTEIAALPVEEFCTKVFPDVLKARREAAIAGDPHAAFVAGGWAHIDPRALHGNSRATVHLAEDFAARFLALKTPRTFVFGEMTYPKTAQEVTADAPDPGMLSAAGVSIAIVPGVGHNLQVGNPEGFVTVLRKALGLE